MNSGANSTYLLHYNYVVQVKFFYLIYEFWCKFNLYLLHMRRTEDILVNLL